MWKIRLTNAASPEPASLEIQRITATESLYSVQIDGTPFEFELDESASGGVLRLQGRVIPFFAAGQSDHVDVWIDGHTYRFRPETKGPARGAKAATALLTNEITAPMPGSVLKINVRPGDLFEAHKPLLVLESMKMELALSAPAAGKVLEVLCRPGELVQMGQVLVRLDAAEAAEAADHAP